LSLSGGKTLAGTTDGFLVGTADGISSISLINDKFPPHLGHTVAFTGNVKPQSSHLSGVDFSKVILPDAPLGDGGNIGTTAWRFQNGYF
jgi:hypothetical protein